MARAAAKSMRKNLIFEPYPSVVDPHNRNKLAFTSEVWNHASISLTEYCDQLVCLSVCLTVCLLSYLKHHVFSVTCSCDLVLLWGHCNMSCTSGFVDCIIFSRNGRPRQLHRQCYVWLSSPDGGTGCWGKVAVYTCRLVSWMLSSLFQPVYRIVVDKMKSLYTTQLQRQCYVLSDVRQRYVWRVRQMAALGDNTFAGLFHECFRHCSNQCIVSLTTKWSLYTPPTRSIVCRYLLTYRMWHCLVWNIDSTSTLIRGRQAKPDTCVE